MRNLFAFISKYAVFSFLVFHFSLSQASAEFAPLSLSEMNQSLATGNLQAFKLNENHSPRSTLIQNPDFLEAALHIVRQAKKSIYLNFYIFSGPRADTLITEVLLKRAEGIEVKIILDASDGGVTGRILHAKAARAIRKRMLAERLDVVNITNIPFGFGRSRRRVNQSPNNHNKFILVDDDKSLVGAINLSVMVDKMEDFAILLEGIDNSTLRKQFLFDFAMSKQTFSTAQYSSACTELINAKQPGPVKFHSNGHCRLDVLKSIVSMINEAQESVDIFVEEIEPIPEIISALTDALKRKVKVRVITEEFNASYLFGPIGKLVPRQVMSAHGIGKLLQMGIDVRLFDGSRKKNVLHGKAMIVDGRKLNIGSANWSEAAFGWVYETNVEIQGGEAAAEFKIKFEEEFERAHSTKGASKFSYWLRSVASWYLTRGAE